MKLNYLPMLFLCSVAWGMEADLSKLQISPLKPKAPIYRHTVLNLLRDRETGIRQHYPDLFFPYVIPHVVSRITEELSALKPTLDNMPTENDVLALTRTTRDLAKLFAYNHDAEARKILEELRNKVWYHMGTQSTIFWYHMGALSMTLMHVIDDDHMSHNQKAPALKEMLFDERINDFMLMGRDLRRPIFREGRLLPGNSPEWMETSHRRVLYILLDYINASPNPVIYRGAVRCIKDILRDLLNRKNQMYQGYQVPESREVFERLLRQCETICPSDDDIQSLAEWSRIYSEHIIPMSQYGV